MKRIFLPTNVIIKLSLIMLALAVVCAPAINANAQALVQTNPRTAWYYVSEKDGTGVGIEIKDNVMFLAWFTYDETGAPNWYTAGGSMSDANNFSGALLHWSGWELGTGYAVPTSEQVGTASVSFTSETTATMNWTIGALVGELALTNFMDVFAPGAVDSRDIIGWWSFPGYNGMGVFIGAQGGSLFMAWFHYGADGVARWWSSGNEAFPSGSSTYTDVLNQYANGQYPGGPYTPPDEPIDVSNIQIDFAGGGRATLIWDGGSLEMVRFPLSDFVSRIFTLGTDYATGAYSTVSASDLSVIPDIGILDSSDNVASQCDDYLFIIRRYGVDAIQVFRKNNLLTPIADYSVRDADEANANPYDIVMFSGSKAYVTRYELPTLLIVNPLTGTQLGTIDLSAYADADGIPEMSQMVYVDGKVFVACQRLNRNDNFTPVPPSLLVVIDPETNEVTNAIELTSTNPGQCDYYPELGKIICAEVGSYFATDGGLDAINPFTETAEGLLITNEALGVVALNSFEFINGAEIFGLMTTATFGTQVKRIDLSTQSVVATLAASDNFDFFEPLALTQNRLFLSDQNMENPGVRVFDASTNAEITATPLSVGSLAPYYLLPF